MTKIGRLYPRTQRAQWSHESRQRTAEHDNYALYPSNKLLLDVRLRNAKKRATVLVAGAIYGGELVPGPCVCCGAVSRNEAHHWDYTLPLDVIWYCPRDHRDLHINLRLGKVAINVEDVVR